MYNSSGRSLPQWNYILKQCILMLQNIPSGYVITTNKKHRKNTCKDFYWHIINTNTNFDTNIFRIAFNTVKKIQTFQYRILPKILNLSRIVYVFTLFAKKCFKGTQLTTHEIHMQGSSTIWAIDVVWLTDIEYSLYF